MKLNKIFMALAATAFVACSSDDLSEFSANQVIEEDSRLVQLDPNFAIAGVGVDDATTRTHWAKDPVSGALVNKFLPIYVNPAPAANTQLDAAVVLEAQAVGLCWLGQAPGENVFTNYQFYHYGWLNVGQATANIECNELLNGAFYSDLELVAAGTADKEAVETNFKYTAASGKTGTPSTALNFNSGVYKTDNKSIFGGDYIVYYPFNPDFQEIGTIPAIAETTFNNVSESYNTAELGKATFRYSAPVTIKGGNRAADFGMYNLSSLVQLRVACPAGDAAIGKKIDQIVLYSAKEQLLKQANLAADKIVAGKKGAGLYADTKGTKTIVANFTAAVTLDKTDGTVKSAYITVLPTKVEDLKVLVHRTDGKWATIDKANTVFDAGKAKRLDVTVADADFTADYIAVDEKSLTTALTEARAAVAADLTGTLRPTITVIGDITLGTVGVLPYAYNITNASDAVITITGDDIIVPEDVTLNVNTIMASEVRVLGKSCCTGANGGILDIQGGTVNNVTMEPTKAKATTPALYDQYNPEVKYTGAATIAAGKTFDVQAGNVNVYTPVAHKGNIQIAEGAKLTVMTGGDLQFMGSTVVNDGTIEVKKNAKYDMTDASGNATAADGKRMTNNGKFIHNVDAGVGTATQSMNQNGEYRCKVDDQVKLDDALLQWTACSVIEMVNASTLSYNLVKGKSVSYKHNGKFIDFEINSGAKTTFHNPKIGSTANGDSEEINVGNLTVTAGGLDIDFVTGTGKRTLTVNGNMTVADNSIIVDSKKINVKKNLTVKGATLTFKGLKKNEEGLAVTEDIIVSDAGQFLAAGTAATDVDALNITCANFTLSTGAKAVFGNRTDGGAKNLVVSGAISNPVGCTFNIEKANQDTNGSVLAWVTCTQLNVGGTFSAARPRVVAAE